MKRIALILTTLVLFSFSMLLAANVEQAPMQKQATETLMQIPATQVEKTHSTMGETVIFMEDFEGDNSAWIMDGGYDGRGGSPDAVNVPSLWEFSEAKSNSPTHSLFHDDDVDASRDFIFSPSFSVPETIDGDPVVSAKLSLSLIHI